MDVTPTKPWSIWKNLSQARLVLEWQQTIVKIIILYRPMISSHRSHTKTRKITNNIKTLKPSFLMEALAQTPTWWTSKENRALHIIKIVIKYPSNFQGHWITFIQIIIILLLPKQILIRVLFLKNRKWITWFLQNMSKTNQKWNRKYRQKVKT